MATPAAQTETAQAREILRACIQKVATGPEYSKDLTREEARAAMAEILAGRAHPVQAGVFLIALRMKRETMDEYKGLLEALRAAVREAEAPVDEVLDLADPYDGYARGLPASPFVPAVLAACGVPTVSHGTGSVGPKYGITHRQVLAAAGAPVDLEPEAAAERLAGPGWAFVDQKAFCPPLHALLELRTLIVKRPALTTLEVLLRPVRGRKATHLVTGYVHKAYPPVYCELARFVGYGSAAVVRGVEGGVIPSLQQPARIFRTVGGAPETEHTVEPQAAGIERDTRAVPLPPDLNRGPGRDEIDAGLDTAAAAARTAELGLAALGGEEGTMQDAMVYGAAICLWHLGRVADPGEGARMAREAIRSSAALARFRGEG